MVCSDQERKRGREKKRERENILLERTLGNTATATARLHQTGTRAESGVSRIRLAVAAHAGCIAVEQGRVLGVFGVTVVVHVLIQSRLSVSSFFLVEYVRTQNITYRVVSLVATLVAQSRLVGKNKVLVSREQADGVVQISGIGQVEGHEIVIAGSRSRKLVLGCLGRRVHETKRGVDKVAPLLNRHVTPFPSNTGLLERAAVVLARGNFLLHVLVDFGHGLLLQLVDGIQGVEAIALTRIIIHE